MTHEMKLAPSPFEMIKSGEKTIELRLYDEKRKAVSIGDAIEFTNTESGEKISARVKAIYVFDSFAELYDSLPLEKCGYKKEELATASPCDMDRYYPAEEQKNTGVCGIEIKRI